MRRVFSRRGGAIVARAASTNDLSMVNGKGRYPNVRIVAIFTNFRREYMGWVLTCRFNTVVTAGTIAGYSDMVEIGR